MSSHCENGLQARYVHRAFLKYQKTESVQIQGVIKTYKLTYESVEVMHALFNKNAANNTWTISASTLRSFAEYFGANTEQLDISSANGHATFTSYTEKVANGQGLWFPHDPDISKRLTECRCAETAIANINHHR